MPVDKSKLAPADKIGYILSNICLRAVIGAFMLLPYPWRVHTMGWLSRHVFAPIAGYRKRIRSNLKIANPDLDEDVIQQLVRSVPDNAGRTVIEIFSTADFMSRAAAAEFTGEGLAALKEAQDADRPVIIVTAHFGNFYAVRARFLSDGHNMGALYRRMANPYFNETYVDKMLVMGGPMFEQGPQGMRDLIRHLRKGGMLGILNDVHVFGGEPLTFFGQPAMTSLATAELALKFDCLLLPVYAIRAPNGLDFTIDVHAPIAHSDPETMTQAINDDLEDMVRRNMGQWFWIHRRWKDARGRSLKPDDQD